MSKLNSIKKPVQEELKAFNTTFDKSISTKVPLLNLVTKYVLKQKGKQIRPLLVFLSAKLINTPNNSTVIGASLIELLHTATLIHDDVVDSANERRGFLSINALWRSKVAVLLGDYMLSKGLLLSIRNNEFELLRIVSEAVEEMSEGELLQIQKSRKLSASESDYFEIIRKKTASLLASCTKVGAASVSNDAEIISKMHDFGLNLGLAFQIKDDLFDYETNSSTGKPKGNDIQEKKLTLPLIKALETASKSDGKKIKKLLLNKKKSNKDIQHIISFVKEQNGVELAKNIMQDYYSKSQTILNSFPDSEAKTALIELSKYIIERNK